jgi:hypothetical protein
MDLWMATKVSEKHAASILSDKLMMEAAGSALRCTRSQPRRHNGHLHRPEYLTIYKFNVNILRKARLRVVYLIPFNYFRVISPCNCTEWLRSKFLGIHKFFQADGF